uniref:SSD domain-containing protein n=1 Tax=Entomoneis paludosa TaxID=265537 RepID=A0A7S2YAG1_9STRA|mmetsp:Transcript_24883/g.51722  ORF Transcript_24883/g.51722 Transcript_24883/m.51722 type:complete len:354 (+) Transcript_24883:87-1148(+)
MYEAIAPAAEVKQHGFSGKWTGMVQAIHAPVVSFLQGLTQLSAKNPKRTISTVATISIFLLVVGLFTNFSLDVDEDKLWTPQGSNAIKHMDWIDDVSGFPESTHDLLMFFHADGSDILGQDQVSRIFEALDAVRAVDNYAEMCADSSYVNADGEKTCEIEGVVKFWSLDSGIFEAEISSDEEAIAAMSNTTFPDGTPVKEKSIFGKPSRNSEGTLTSALSYTVSVKFPPTDAAEKFEDKVLDILLDMRDNWADDKSNSLVLEVTAEGSFGDEFERAIFNDIPLIPLVFLIMSVFTALVFTKRDKVQSRAFLGFCAVLAVLLSLLSGFGFLFICGVPFTSMTQILPFVIFGIGE